MESDDDDPADFGPMQHLFHMAATTTRNVQNSLTLSQAQRVAGNQPPLPPSQQHQRRLALPALALRDAFDTPCCKRKCWEYLLTTHNLLLRLRASVQDIQHDRSAVGNFARRAHGIILLGDGDRCCIIALLRIFGISRNALYHK
jgi:hypothetical protein